MIDRNKNPYNLTQKQLDELEVTKKQVSEHINTIDFSKHDQVPSSNPDLEHKADVVRRFAALLKDNNRRSK